MLKPPRLFTENKRPDLRRRHQLGPTITFVSSPHVSAPPSSLFTSHVGVRILIASNRSRQSWLNYLFHRRFAVGQLALFDFPGQGILFLRETDRMPYDLCPT
ncbi:MAG: hypothetical protein ACLP9L_02175 [Thermoguttaceae bacterium]